MAAVVIVESVALVVLGLFAAALLHSYAGLARRVEELPGRPVGAPMAQNGPPKRGREAADVVGLTTDGEEAAVTLAGRPFATLIAFLSSGCVSCRRFFAEAEAVSLPEDVRLLIVTKDPEEESPQAVSALAGAVEVVMSSAAWAAYQVPGSPYFVLVDGVSSTVLGGGTGQSWREVLDLLALATGDEAHAGGRPRRQREAERERAIDEILLAAGIGPDHPSLYPHRHGAGPK